MAEYLPIHFYDEAIEVGFRAPPTYEKSPPCPDRFIWNERTFHVMESVSEQTDFTRRGKMARNMRPAHAELASTRGSLNVGRFYFRVYVNTDQIFDIYYDRAMKNVDQRKGAWFLYRELAQT